jgi:hypothetical protein
MSVRGKVITTLKDRLELERQLAMLLEVQSEQEFTRQARRIATGGDQVIPVILRNLGHAGARQLNALGVVASMYPHQAEILNKLYEAAADMDRPDGERVSAMLILERFLGEAPDPYLLQTLDDPRAIAIESIRDLIDTSEQDPAVLVEYMRALSAQPKEAIAGIMDTLLEISQERAVPVLSLFSQHDDDELASMALHTLGRLRHPDAARGLQVLASVLPSSRRALGERSLLKLRLSGVPVAPLPQVSPSWRALIGPLDGQGTRVVWFIHDPDEHQRCHFLGVSLNEAQGLVQAYGNHAVPSQAVPARGRPGHVHRVPFQPMEASEGSSSKVTTLFLLEADLDYGRRLVKEAQVRSFEAGRALPAAYRLLSPLIWQYDASSLESSRQLPPTPAQTLELLSQTASLPYHPFFRGWYIGGDHTAQIAEAMLHRTSAVDQEMLRTWATRIAEAYFDETNIQQVRARLLAMSEWLWQAEQIPLVELTTVAAKTIVEIPPAQHPFAISMAELGLNLMVYQLQ